MCDNLKSTLFLIFFLLQYLISTSTAIDKNPCGQLYLTQSPAKGKYLELNWNFTCEDPPDEIVLTYHDLKVDNDAKILYTVFPGKVLKRYHKTNYSLDHVRFPGNWNEEDDNPDLRSHCFDYYIASLKNNILIYSQCLAIHPTWMSQFGDLRIGNMIIPGTHNSGAYQGAPSLIKKYVLNQDKNFWQQLVYGIRYFDIRIGRYGQPPDGLYINHNFIKCTALLPELKSVLNFIKKSPKEIIVLNFHQFPRPKKFLKDYHIEIINLIRNIFGNSIFPFPRFMHRYGPTLKEIWQSGKQVIISYGNNTLVQEIYWLWPSVRREWGNVQNVNSLEKYIQMVMSTPPRGNPMNVLMAELTPNYLFVLQHLDKNLRNLASIVNKEINYWILQNNSSDSLNIIATDFFTGNDVINVAIETNFRKLRYMHTQNQMIWVPNNF